MMLRHRTTTMLLATVLVLLATMLLPPADAHAGADVEIVVLSNRADLVSGGDALVEVVLPDGADPTGMVVRNHGPDPSSAGTDISDAFALRPNGRTQGLVADLPVGPNVLTATLADGRGARLTVTNHPIGGPIFSGPQIDSWTCETERNQLGPALDEQCNAPTVVDYLYKSNSGIDVPFATLRPYDPSAPPPDVAETTTDEGITVPYVVRRERGTINRGVYEIAVLWDPEQPWEPWAPQEAWNEKLYYYFSGGSAPQRRQGFVEFEVQIDRALSRGYAVAYSSLNRFGFNTNSVTSAETVMMVQERVTETLGPFAWTVGEGGSGGSIQQHLIAEGYPGLLDGIQAGATFQDLWTVATEVQDCSLLVEYFTQTSPQLWLDSAQQDAVMGNEPSVPGTCESWLGFWIDRLGFDPVTGFACFGGNGVGPGVPQPFAYHPVTNPTGARCTLQDNQIAMFGARPEAVWGPVEASLGAGFAGRAYDNVGVQYGLLALDAGEISVAQFLDLNERIGGRDIDNNPQTGRSVADAAALDIAYRTGQVNSGRGMTDIPVFDLRNCSSNEIHSCFHTWVLRARMLEAGGGTAGGHAIHLEENLDRSIDIIAPWLDAIAADTSGDPAPVVVARHRPAAAVDTCWIGGEAVTDMAACIEANPFFADPRIAAGGPMTADVLKCQLRTPLREDYAVDLSDDEWTRLLAAFPDGVCDWTRDGVGTQPSIPWLTFLADDGTAIPGGSPLGAAPESVPFGPAVPDASLDTSAPNDAASGSPVPATDGAGGSMPATGGAMPIAALVLALAVAARPRREGQSTSTTSR